MRSRPLMLLAAVLAAAGGQLCAQDTVALERIFGTPYLAGSRPSLAGISPDGRFLLVRWDSSARGSGRTWLMHADGSGMHQIADTLLGEVAWGEGGAVACTRRGDIFLTDTSFSSFRRVTKTDANEHALAWSKDGRELFYETDRSLMALAVDRPGIFDLAQASGKDVSVRRLDVTPDARRVLFVESNREGLTDFLTPRYTGTDVTTTSFKGGVEKVRLGIAPVDTGATAWITLPGDGRWYLGDVAVSPDGRNAVVERFSADRKKREIYLAGLDDGRAKLVREETDKAWVEGGLAMTRWLPDGSRLLTTSERDGWNHLYLLDTSGRGFRQLTSGAWEVRWFDIAPDGRTVYLCANADDHAQWQLYAFDLAKPALRRLTVKEGSYENPVMAADGSFIVCGYSDFARPTELVRVPTAPGGAELQLTRSIPDEFSRIRWTVPQIVHFRSRDGKQIPAMIYAPEHLDRSKKHPVVVFVHGAGYLQNVYRGWSFYSREYMFHHRLVQKGYIVFEVEYRGSAGLGREFRTDVYMHLGGKDLDDEVDGLEYLSGLGYIDTQRVGIYGGSYGGFMTLMAMFLTDRYACGAALRAVTSWENYYRHNPWYTEARLGKPEDHPDAYRISSPITYADSLRRPLLVLHGMVDDNVFFQDAVQLIARLQKAGKKFEAMVYPVEGHGFREPESWYDEYRRIEEFFDAHLQK